MDGTSRTPFRSSCALGFAALAVAGCRADGGGEATEDPAPSAAPRVVVGAAVTCPGGAEPRPAVFRHGGYASFTEMLKSEADFRGAYAVDRDAAHLLYLRDDGSVHTEVDWMGEADPAAGRRSDWFPSGESACPDEESWTAVPPDLVTGSRPLTLEVGHCWIEPVAFDAREWDVVDEDQFGWGGQQPRGFRSKGEAWQAGDVVTYVDESGHWLTLVPAGDPWAPERGPCA